MMTLQQKQQWLRTQRLTFEVTLPYPFFDFDALGIMASAGASQNNLTVFEKAPCLRQLAITTATQSITEAARRQDPTTAI